MTQQRLLCNWSLDLRLKLAIVIASLSLSFPLKTVAIEVGQGPPMGPTTAGSTRLQDNADLPSTEFLSLPVLLEKIHFDPAWQSLTPSFQGLTLERKSYRDAIAPAERRSDIAGGRQVYVIQEHFSMFTHPGASRVKNAQIDMLVDAQTGEKLQSQISGCYIDPYGLYMNLTETVPRRGELTQAEIFRRANLPENAIARNVGIVRGPGLEAEKFPSNHQPETIPQEKELPYPIWHLDFLYPGDANAPDPQQRLDTQVIMAFDAKTGELLRKEVDCQVVFSAL